MGTTVERCGDVAVVDIAGDLDASSSPAVRGDLEELLGEGFQNFVVNLGEVGFVDSSGLATLVHVFKRVRIGNGDLRLAALQPSVSQLFALTRLDKVFEVYPERPAALASFNGG